MDFRTAYALRLEKSSLRQKRLGTLAVFSVATGVAALLIPELAASNSERHAGAGASLALAAAPLATSATAAQPDAPRRIYPYSIIPGGVSGVEELKRVMRADKVVAAHYADFDVGSARAVTVTKPRAVYVSYRKGDQVFWTAKKLMLVQGETLLSDGRNEMRARCANRISDVPRFPVEPHGPSEEELDIALASAPEDIEGMFLATAAGIEPEQGGGARYRLAYFPDGGGLVRPASPPATRPALPPALPHPERSPGYGSTGPVHSMGQISASHSDPGARPGAGASDGGVPDGGIVLEPAPTPQDSTPVDDLPTTPPGSGTPGTPGTPGTEPDDDVPGTVDQPSTPPHTGPELPPNVPTPPGVPPATPGDVDIPAPPVDVPEPGTLWLSSAAIAAMLWLRRKGHGVQH